MPNITVNSGMVASGYTVTGRSITVQSGGATVSISLVQGTEIILSGGTATATNVTTASTITVSNGGVASSSQISSGGHEYVSSGGTDSGAQVNSGGNLYVYSGGLAGGATINNGGILTVSSGGAEVSGMVASGGAIKLVNGTAQSFADTIQGVGFEFVYSGATASGTVVSGYLYVSRGGTAVSATADQGGNITVSGIAATTMGDLVQSGGQQYVDSGAVASNTLVSGYLAVSSGGESVSATIIQNGTVTVGGTAALTIGDTVLSGGSEYVYSGAVASGAQVSGFMAVSGGGQSVSAMVGNSGTLVVGQFVPSTGIVIPTGVLVATQAIDSSSVINSGGTLVISNLGLGLNETVGAFATAYVYSGGVASGTNIGSSGVMNVSSGGMAISANAASGGVLNVGGTGALTSNAMISAGGREYVYSAGVASGSVVQGYEYVSAGGEAMFTTVGSGGMVAVEQTGASTVNATLLSGGTEYVYSAGLASATTVSAGGNLLIEPFGASLGATDAGREVVFGGVASNTTVLSGGVLSAGRAGGVGNEVISTGVDILTSGTVVSAVISAGGTEYINADGIGRATTVLGGGAVYVHGEFLIGTVGVVIPTGTPGPILLPAGVTIGDLLASGGIEYVASGATASLTTVSAGGDLVVNSGGTIAGTALQFGGTIDVTSLTYSSAGFFTFNSGTDLLTVTMGGNSFSETLTGSYTSASFSIVNDGDGGTDILACYAAGTLIATPDGETAVEELREGDLVRTASGEARKVRWIGHRQIDAVRHPNPDAILPVRIAAHAFGPALPARDLYVSPDHALFLDGVLIPAGLLANGTTIRQIARASVTYFHVELDLHDVILAEGLPAESYLDTGNRAHFANGGAATTLHANFTAASWDGACSRNSCCTARASMRCARGWRHGPKGPRARPADTEPQGGILVPRAKTGGDSKFCLQTSGILRRQYSNDIPSGATIPFRFLIFGSVAA